jgi:hypothetical protein
LVCGEVGTVYDQVVDDGGDTVVEASRVHRQTDEGQSRCGKRGDETEELREERRGGRKELFDGSADGGEGKDFEGVGDA